MALMTVDSEETGEFRSKPRWSANKKLDAVIRLLRGEKLEEVSRELGVEAHRLAAWRDEFIEGGKVGLREEPPPVGNPTIEPSVRPSARSAS
jgi:transposase